MKKHLLTPAPDKLRQFNEVKKLTAWEVLQFLYPSNWDKAVKTEPMVWYTDDNGVDHPL